MGDHPEMISKEMEDVSRALALLFKRILQRLSPQDALWMYDRLMKKVDIPEA